MFYTDHYPDHPDPTDKGNTDSDKVTWVVAEYAA